MPKDQLILPLFPLPGVVMFPGMNLPLHIFEERYKKLISTSLKKNKTFGIVFAKENICSEVGTIVEIIDVEKLEDGKLNILTEGKKRFKIVNFMSKEPYYEALIQPYEDKEVKINEKFKKTIKEVSELSKKALGIFDTISEQDLSKKLKLPTEPNELLFLVAANLTCPTESKQLILESQSIKERANKVLELLKEEIERLQILLANKETKSKVTQNGKLKIN